MRSGRNLPLFYDRSFVIAHALLQLHQRASGKSSLEPRVQGQSRVDTGQIGAERSNPPLVLLNTELECVSYEPENK